MRTVADEKDDALAPLRRAIEEVANLNEAIAKAEDRPEEERLRSLWQELSKAKGDLMSLGRALMLNQDPSLVTTSWSRRSRRPRGPSGPDSRG